MCVPSVEFKFIQNIIYLKKDFLKMLPSRKIRSRISIPFHLLVNGIKIRYLILRYGNSFKKICIMKTIHNFRMNLNSVLVSWSLNQILNLCLNRMRLSDPGKHEVRLSLIMNTIDSSQIYIAIF